MGQSNIGRITFADHADVEERCGGSPATVGLENVVAAEIVVRVTGLKFVPSFPFPASSSCPIFPRRRQTVCVALFIGIPFFFFKKLFVSSHLPPPRVTRLGIWKKTITTATGGRGKKLRSFAVLVQSDREKEGSVGSSSPR